jgi:superfamily II DNA or RNA helicase
MTAYYIISQNGQKYYYQDGTRITEAEGIRLNARKKTVSGKKSPVKRKKGLIPCKSHQYRNPETNRCKNKSGLKKKKTPKSPKSPKKTRKKSRVPCKSYQIRNPKTGRCRNKSGLKKKKSPKKSPKKTPKSPKKTPKSRKKSRVPCKSHQYRDPKTGRCRNKSGLKKKKSPKKSPKKTPKSPKKTPKSPKKTPKSRKKSRVPCKSHQYRDPKTGRCKNKKSHVRDRRRSNKVPCKSHQYRDPVDGRCKNKSGHQRQRSRVRDPVQRSKKSGRWKRVKKIIGDCVKRSKLKLRDLQIKVVQFMEKKDGLLVVHGTGCGKCHGIDTPILMHNGTIKMVQDIETGDNLMGIDSKPRKVLSLARGEEEMFKIIQSGGGKDYTVNASHILTLKISHPKGIYHTVNKGIDYIVANYFNKNNYKRSSKWFKIGDREVSEVREEAKIFLETVHIDDIVDIPLQDYLKLSKSNQRLLKGFRSSVDFPEQKNPLDPYFIGLWLGDGCSRNPAITTADPEIVEYLKTEFEEYSIRIAQDGLTHHIGNLRKNEIHTQLQKLNLIQNKHIPSIYLKNSRKNRLKLLAGLIDSDGWFGTGGCYEIEQKSKQLTDDIEYLLRSLGARVTVKEVQKGKGEYKQIYNRISFSVDFDIPVILNRKQCTPNPNKDLLRNEIKVISLGAGKYYGFELDGNHRYLLGDFSVTHNTLTAITCSQCYLDKYPDKGVVFVGPASLVSNFKKEMKAYGVENSDQYEFYSYDKFMLEDKGKRPISLTNKMLIVDEVHNLRNPKSKKSQTVVKAALQADKRLLLTATPFVNSMTDFIPLINMIYGKMIVGTRKMFYNDETDEWIGASVNDENLTTFRYLLEDKVDMVDCRDPEFFPERIDHYTDVEMSTEYYKRYEKLVAGEGLYGIMFKDPSAFYNGYRRAVNRAGPEYYSQKVKAALPILRKGKSIIFTNWVDFGVRPITDALKKNGLSFRTFFGDASMDERLKMVIDFNKGDFDVLVLTRAGGEGIDLKEVRSVVVLDPPWNDAGLQQVVGRAIRFKSHIKLPLSQRKVDVYFMLLVPPKNISDDKAAPSGDTIIYSIIERKNEISVILLALLKELSI